MGAARRPARLIPPPSRLLAGGQVPPADRAGQGVLDRARQPQARQQAVRCPPEDECHRKWGRPLRARAA
eukprot:7294699-Prymnesium_polylepis.1